MQIRQKDDMHGHKNDWGQIEALQNQNMGGSAKALNIAKSPFLRVNRPGVSTQPLFALPTRAKSDACHLCNAPRIRGRWEVGGSATILLED